MQHTSHQIAIDTEAQRSLEEWLALALERERGGELEGAVTAYNRALTLEESCVEALHGLCELRRDMGEPDRARVLARRLVDLGDPRGQVLLDELEEENETDSNEPSGPALASRYQEDAPPRFTDSHLVTMAELFAGRRGVYARQWVAPDGRAGYSPVREPLTPAVLRAHLLGACTVGLYVVRQDNNTNLLALDVDVSRPDFGDLPRAEAKAAVERTRETALALCRVARELGLAPLLETSGHKGHHVWVFFDEPWAAWKARRLARSLVAAVSPLPVDVAVDAFPAQAQVKPGGLGNLIKLPLGVHRKSGRRSVLLDELGTRASDPFVLLEATRRAPVEILEGALTTLQSQSCAAEEPPPEYRDSGTCPKGPGQAPSEKDPAAAIPACAVPLDPYELDADEELAFLLARCSALAQMATKARSGMPLSQSEQNALTYTVGHLTHGPAAVCALLTAAGNIAPPLGNRLRGHPTSCPKVRSRLGITKARGMCDCEFDESLGSYPHPLLHLAGLRAEQELSTPLGETPLPVEELVKLRRDREKLRAELERLGRLLDTVDQRLSVAAPVVLAPPVKALPAPRPLEMAAGEE